MYCACAAAGGALLDDLKATCTMAMRLFLPLRLLLPLSLLRRLRLFLLLPLQLLLQLQLSLLLFLRLPLLVLVLAKPEPRHVEHMRYRAFVTNERLH